MANCSEVLAGSQGRILLGRQHDARNSSSICARDSGRSVRSSVTSVITRALVAHEADDQPDQIDLGVMAPLLLGLDLRPGRLDIALQVVELVEPVDVDEQPDDAGEPPRSASQPPGPAAQPRVDGTPDNGVAPPGAQAARGCSPRRGRASPGHRRATIFSVSSGMGQRRRRLQQVDGGERAQGLVAAAHALEVKPRLW
jgi:hypothetical protein